ncbi:DNA glycosylase [Pilobolus umbonatus]|nr:DNA glycosylase [Pilobolus umbonatus]
MPLRRTRRTKEILPVVKKTIKKTIKEKKIKAEKTQNIHPPDTWNSVYDRIQEFRTGITAPVDTMGCERLADETASRPVQRFQTLFSLMLSSQTKDTVTSVVVRKLQKELPHGLCLGSILEIDEAELDKMISPIGFHTKKASYIKQTAVILRDQYMGDIPDTAEDLVKLPGVGPKMAYLTLQVAWNKNMGIGVDVHVHRISNRLGWVKTNTPEETRESLQSWLPKDKWKGINPMLVGFGQTVCLPRGPRCDICPVSEYCPSAVKTTKKTSVKKETVYVKKEEEIKQEPVELEW